MKDVTLNEKFGKLLVTELLPDHFSPSGERYQRVQVSCDCGFSYAINSINLFKGTKYCPQCARASLTKYHVGDRYDKVVILELKTRGAGARIARCLCDCGQETEIRCVLLTRNKNVNCGCSTICTYTGIEDLSGAYFYNLQTGAKKRKLPFNITKELLWELFLKQNKKCALTGIPITLCVRNRTEGTASVDRIDSSVGYEPENVHWVHKEINKMKQGFSIPKLIALCTQIVNYDKGILPDYSEIPESILSRPRKRGGNRPNESRKKHLTITEILSDADKFYALYSRYPKSNEKLGVPDKAQESWKNFDRALRKGERCLPPGDSLSRLLARERGAPSQVGRPKKKL